MPGAGVEHEILVSLVILILVYWNFCATRSISSSLQLAFRVRTCAYTFTCRAVTLYASKVRGIRRSESSPRGT